MPAQQETTEKLPPADAAHSAFIENQRMLMHILHEMKEVPELESEKPKDTMPLEKVEFPPEGGVQTFMAFMDAPYAGFPHFEIVERIDLIKKIARAIVSGLFHRMKKRGIFSVFLVPLSLFLLKDLVHTNIYAFWRLIARFRLKPMRYSPAIRELHRAFSIEQDSDRELRLMLRDIICMILEFDNAYRFRFQDVIVELDKVALERHPFKEVKRLINLMASREMTQEIKDTWTLVKYAIINYLRYDRTLLSVVLGVLKRLRLDACELTDADKSYCAPRKDYRFGFVLYPTEKDAIIIGRAKATDIWVKHRTDIMDDSKIAIQRLHEKHLEEQKSVPQPETLIPRQVQEMKDLTASYEAKLKEKEEEYVIEKRKYVFS